MVFGGEGTLTREQANFAERRSGVTEFAYPDAPDPLDIFRQATAFVAGILEDSRTPKAAFVRLAAAKWIFFRKEPASKIAKRLGVSRQRFHRVVRELRRDCGIG